MSHRRSHTKSRHGCLQCKKNRTKCDEERPSCSRCVRTGKRCSLIDQDSALFMIPDARSHTPKQITQTSPKSTAAEPTIPVKTITPQESPASRYTDENETPDETRFASTEIDRLRLMNYYARSVADSVANFTFPSEYGLNIWRVDIPRLALEHEFLLQGLFSISSLHFAASNKSEWDKYISLAIGHYNTGVALFRSQLANITSENIDALFAFSCMTALYSFRIHRTGLSQINSLAKIHEVLTVLRGASVIVATGNRWLGAGLWGPTLLLDTVGTPGRLSTEMEDLLADMSQRIDSTITTSSNRELYTGAIEALRRSFWVATTRPSTQLAIVLFPITVPPEFLNMVCIAEPLALAILANWAVILHWQRQHMWVEGWGKETIDAVQQALSPEWYSCISWAVKEVTGE